MKKAKTVKKETERPYPTTAEEVWWAFTDLPGTERRKFTRAMQRLVITWLQDYQNLVLRQTAAEYWEYMTLNIDPELTAMVDKVDKFTPPKERHPQRYAEIRKHRETHSRADTAKKFKTSKSNITRICKNGTGGSAIDN